MSPVCLPGGDYDGDIALVCWDPDLVPRTSVEPPAYTAAAELPSNRIGEEELVRHWASQSNAMLGRWVCV